MLLATRNGKAIRFRATDVREFQSRTSAGVRGAKLLGDDEVISLSILHGTPWDQDTETREAYLTSAPVEGGRSRGPTLDRLRDEMIRRTFRDGARRRSSS